MIHLPRTLQAVAAALALSAAALPTSAQPNDSPRERFNVTAAGQPEIALQRQAPHGSAARPDVVYVHGGTFGADLSVFYPFDGRSWADSLSDAGFPVWGFDFVGYGASGRYSPATEGPAGTLDVSVAELHRVIVDVRKRNGNRPVVLLAHSRGGAVAARYVNVHPQDVRALVLFAPIVTRAGHGQPGVAAAAAPSHAPLSAWAQYRRFVEDVPRGQPQVLSEAHFQKWSEAFLATDRSSGSRTPPAVMTPYGPLADIAAMWNGRALYDPSNIQVPTLIVRGEWDSLCTDSDAQRLLLALGSQVKKEVTIPHATHLMHLEQQRAQLYRQVNDFLLDVL